MAYRGFDQLAGAASEGIDFRRELRSTRSGVAHLAVHGGGIEAGTAEAADAIAAANGHDYYAFVGLRDAGNAELHIPSIHFDEPTCAELQRTSRRTVSYHGCVGDARIIHLGGADLGWKQRVGTALTDAGFTVDWHTTENLDGTDVRNICNRNASGAGLQLEMSAGLRAAFFPGGRTSRAMRESGRRTDLFRLFVSAVAAATVSTTTRSPAADRTDSG
jgi:phage replication-related protein YjqB (UPF0714/DUF867 family)